MNAYLRDLLDRATKTAAMSALLAVGADQVNAINGVDWYDVGGFALGGALLSVLTNVSQRGLFGRE